jgi:Lon protease-like protein
LESIPDAWPSAGSALAPIFPLPGFFLYPGTVVPLHIFEPRYREMIEDLLDGPGRLVMGTVVDGHENELAGAPPVYPIAGLGEIGRHERLPDGRFNLLLVGLSRARVHEVESDRQYRKVEVETLEETPVAEERERALRMTLQKAILARCDEFLNLPALMPITNLADLLIQRMDLPLATVQRLFSELDVEKRANAALHEHDHRPLRVPPPKP